MRKHIAYIILCLLFFSSAFAQKNKTTEKDYIFFLHNRFAEENELDVKHPEYGKVEYKEILENFRKDGFVVFSEKRGKTNVTEYASYITLQIDSLIATGTKPDHITVIGTSKGGYIAQFVSTYLANPDVNFIFIGCFNEKDLTEMPEINFCGNILSIYEKSDPYGVSAIKRKETSKLKVTRFQEIELNTGLKHGFLFKALPVWTAPCKKWAQRKYNEV
jgi:hypothetical protein